ncbi:MAG: tandem-95 repeat protein [Gammaproteobacteria bacterium]|nr:tandem-95 repeat protein [Gammaproteobacteria bacterium]
MRLTTLLVSLLALTACGGGDDGDSTPPPTALAGSFTLDEDTMIDINLSGQPQNGGALSFQISQQPSNGSLNGSGSSWTYSPNADFNGTDSIKFTVSENGKKSSAATVSFTINPVNDAPTANNVSLSLNEDEKKTGQFDSFDIDGDSLTFTVSNAPSNGTITLGEGSSFSFMPSDDYFGTDIASISVSDGELSATFELSIDILPINDAPIVPEEVNVTLQTGMTEFMYLSGTDIDSEELSLELLGRPSWVGYTAATNLVMLSLPFGEYPSGQFRYQVNDGLLDSNVGNFNYQTDPSAVALSAGGGISEPVIYRGVAAANSSLIIASRAETPSPEANLTLWSPEDSLSFGFEDRAVMVIDLPAGATELNVLGLETDGAKMMALVSFDNGSFTLQSATISDTVPSSLQSSERHNYSLLPGANFENLTLNFYADTGFIFERNNISAYQSGTNLLLESLDFGVYDSISNVRVLDTRERNGKIEWLIDVIGKRVATDTEGSIGTYLVTLNTDFAVAAIDVSTSVIDFSSDTGKIQGSFLVNGDLALASNNRVSRFSGDLTTLWSVVTPYQGTSQIAELNDGSITTITIADADTNESSMFFINNIQQEGSISSTRLFSSSHAVSGEIIFDKSHINSDGSVTFSYFDIGEVNAIEILIYVDANGNPKLSHKGDVSLSSETDAGDNSALSMYTIVGDRLVRATGNGDNAVVSSREIIRTGY